LACAKDYLYFYVRTEKPITPQTDLNWMAPLIAHSITASVAAI